MPTADVRPFGRPDRRPIDSGRPDGGVLRRGWPVAKLTGTWLWILDRPNLTDQMIDAVKFV